MEREAPIPVPVQTRIPLLYMAEAWPMPAVEIMSKGYYM